MDGYGSRGRSVFSFERLVSLVVLLTYFFSSLPIRSHCNISLGAFREGTLDDSEIQAQLLSKFNEIKHTFASCANRNLEAINAVQSLLDEIASTYNIIISVADLLEITKTQLNGIQLNGEARQYLTQVIHNFQMTNSAIGVTITETVIDQIPMTHSQNSNHFDVFGYGIYPPWKWKWFGLNKQNHSDGKRQLLVSRQVTYPGPIPQDDGSIPDDLIICGVEALVIALLLLIPSGYTQILAGAIAYDMGSRAIDGVKEVSSRNAALQREFNP